MTRISPPHVILRVAMLPVLLLVALCVWLPAEAAASPRHDRALHLSHALHHDAAGADSQQGPSVVADCPGAAFFCAMMGLCHPALSPFVFVMPERSDRTDPAALAVAGSSGRDPAIITPPPRPVFI